MTVPWGPSPFLVRGPRLLHIAFLGDNFRSLEYEENTKQTEIGRLLCIFEKKNRILCKIKTGFHEETGYYVFLKKTQENPRELSARGMSVRAAPPQVGTGAARAAELEGLVPRGRSAWALAAKGKLGSLGTVGHRPVGGVKAALAGRPRV